MIHKFSRDAIYHVSTISVTPIESGRRAAERSEHDQGATGGTTKTPSTKDVRTMVGRVEFLMFDV